MSHKRRLRKMSFTNHRKAVPLMFQGELMTCALCGKEQQSDPEVETNWRCIGLENDFYYVCTEHFPPDETATVEDFKLAYLVVISLLLEIRKGKGADDVVQNTPLPAL